MAERLGTLGCIEYEMHVTVLDGVDHVGAAFENLVNPLGGYAFSLKETLRPPGGHYLEAEIVQEPDGRHDAGLVGIAHRYEHSSRAWHFRSSAELAFGESGIEVGV